MDGLALNHEFLDRYVWISVPRVEREFLSRRFAYGEDVIVLYGTILDDGDQLHISPNPCAENNRQLESTDAGEISVCTEGAAEDYALVEAARLCGHYALLP